MNKYVKKEWVRQALKDLGIKKYTAIQNETIPKILQNENCIGISATGTGKTYCFLIPILEKLDDKKEIQSIVVLPTRELARQINSKFAFFKNYHNFYSELLIGGQIKKENKNKQIIISTPQKLIDFLLKKKPNLNFLNSIVFDEADMLIDKNFADILKNIFDLLPNRMHFQKIAFSATLHEMLSKQLAIYFGNTEIYQDNKSIWNNSNKIDNNLIHFLEEEKRMEILLELLNNLNPYFCIIFANRKTEVENIHKIMKMKNFDVLMLHGDLESRSRKNVYKMIDNKNIRFLVSTDLASRGIDILGVSHVISYNLPKEDLWFMHRIGRTGRNYQSGITYTLASKKDEIKISRLKSKGIDWNNFKINKGKLENYDYLFKKKPNKKFSEVDKEIKLAISTSSKKVKPNYKKKTKLKIKEIKRQAKRKAIEKAVKQNLIKKYKIENSKKGKIKNEI